MDKAKFNTIVINGIKYLLLPGLIDLHVHINTPEQINALAAYGVTAVYDIACFPALKL